MNNLRQETLESLTAKALLPGTEVIDLQELAGFDALALKTGELLLAQLSIAHPAARIESPDETMYPSEVTIEKRFRKLVMAFRTTDELDFKAIFVEPTLPNDIWHVRDQHVNFISTIRAGDLFATVETKIFLGLPYRREQQVVRARKQVGNHILVYDKERYADSLARLLIPRMRYRPAISHGIALHPETG